ncbi:hypothetical protein O181_052206 [Austropuccinia psidii MF-1]|uniref:Uncharacterized protein n=1 Tax=Austropuccinia psidii MF-1 TaxID=1389203 RepID=A0A9Q3DXW8_9BASI|nr:hypothetical protein [Austropuccinia psidii MF-1]
MKEDESKESLPKPKEMSIIQLKKDDSATAIAKVEKWGNWQPPTISSANEPFLNNYGLRNTKKRTSRTEITNQDASRSHPKGEKLMKKRPNIPGAYTEDEQKEEEKTIIQTKYKKPQQVQKEKEIPPQEPKDDHTGNTQDQSIKSMKGKVLRKKNEIFKKLWHKLSRRYWNRK